MINCSYALCNKILLQPLNAFHVTKKVSILKIDSDAFYALEVTYILLLRFSKFLKTNRGCVLNTDSDICDGFLTPN